MRTLDLAIIAAYLVGITLFGILFSRKQETTRDYFLGGRSVPWWAIAASIVATETSTVTFISVPGVAFAKGGNFQFLQLVVGYMIGRVVISLLFIPSYFRGDLLTVYQLLDRRFGGRIKMLAATLFIVMRNIADGVRLLLTAIVLAAVYAAFQPDADADAIIVYSIILLGLVMIVFTYFGGMEAVIWVEVVQLGVYIAGALAAAFVLASAIGGGFGGALSVGAQFDKFDIIDLGFRQTMFTLRVPFTETVLASFALPLDVTKAYTFFAGLLGGCFLTMSTHGTDQYFVQRYLCTDRPSRAAQALLTSGAVVLAQFIGFLFIGALLFAYYQPYADPNYAALAAGRATLPLDGAFSAVAPTASSPISSQSTCRLVVGDRRRGDLRCRAVVVAQLDCRDRRQRPLQAVARRADDRHLLKVSHVLTLVWGVVQILIALAFRRSDTSALNQALAVASLINGPVLGVFLVGTLLRRVGEPPALIGMVTSMIVMFFVSFGTNLAWPWYAFVGSAITLAVAWLASHAFAPAPVERQDELSPAG